MRLAFLGFVQQNMQSDAIIIGAVNPRSHKEISSIFADQ